MKYFSTLFFISLFFSAKAQNSVAPEASAKKRLDTLQRFAAQTAALYKAMDNITLLKKLTDQSKSKKEPFNSLAYRELRTRKNVDADSLKMIVFQEKNGDALLPLLLLRERNDKTYEELPISLKSSVLTDALRRSVTFNAWGLPNFYLEDASRALISCGKAALPGLRHLLTEKRDAPVYGSKESMEYERYRYRLCDYALFFIEQIQGNRNFVMPVDPETRDSLIKKLY